MIDTAVKGRIVANYGRRVLVEDSAGKRHLCIPKGRRLGLVCGDWVHWNPRRSDSGVVHKMLDRTTTLERPNNRGQTEVLAANITQLLIVVCHEPMLDPFLIDRYLVTTELMGVECCLVWNKLDKLPPKDEQTLEKKVLEFSRIGYDMVKTSAKSRMGMDELAGKLNGHTSILVGQSGVGKSSLLNTLIPGLDAATAAISDATGEGKHTTTTAVLHHVPGGGEIIDSPGIRDYAPPPVAPEALAAGFPEFAKARRCRFNDCSHLREPDCGVVAAVEAGEISQRRFESYRRLSNTMRKLQSKR